MKRAVKESDTEGGSDLRTLSSSLRRTSTVYASTGTKAVWNHV